jgi:uncharacterized membrane protein
MAGPQDEIDALTEQVAKLTARVYQLERRAGVQWPERTETIPEAPARAAVAAPTEPALEPPVAVTVPPAPPEAVAAPPATPRLRPTPTAFQPAIGASSRAQDVNLEKKIGQYWLNRIGIVAILVGVSYFLKYAFENNWIGPAGRVAIGLLTGIGLVLWSERFRAKGYNAFSYSLKAVGIGTLYLSLWGAFQVYHLIPAGAAFVAMTLVTAATIALALRQDAELLASFALIGGFGTPVLLSTGQNHEAVLFSYVALLDLAVLAMAISKPWRRLLWGSFAGTVLLYMGWYSDYYSADQLGLTVFFAALFFAIFAAVPLATRYGESTRFTGPSVTLMILPLLNAAAFFLALYEMYERDTATLTWYALGLAAVYLGISSLFQRRFPDQDNKFLNLLHVAIAIAFITIAIPLKLNAQWITIGWLIESAVLLWISVKVRVDFLRFLAVAALALGIGRLLLIDRFHTDRLVINPRFATYLVAIAVLGGIIGFGKAHATEREKPFLQLAMIFLNLLALIALTLEASDYFDRQLAILYQTRFAGMDFTQLRLERDFSYSAIWLVYGAALMAVGFSKRSSFIRWQSLVLIAVTIAKVFLYDVSALDKGYRILSFVALGAVLLGISFVYQRDWLKLSSRTPEERAGEPS